MKISVTRNTGWIGFAVRLKVFINGVEMAKVANSATQFLDIPLPEGNAAILTIKSIRSSNLEVKDGDQVLIETNPTYTTFFVVALGLLFTSTLLRHFSTMPSILVSFLAFAFLIATFFFPQYKLSKINRP